MRVSGAIVTRRIILVSVIALVALVVMVSSSVSAENDSSNSGSDTCGIHPICPASISSSSTTIYDRYGGSAQAYKPGAPVSTNICEVDSSDDDAEVRHKVARWPLYRSSSASAPIVRISGRVHSCAADSETKVESLSCSSNLIADPNDIGAASGEDTIVIEAWQTRPDGTYSSLRPGVDDRDCRATIVPSSDGTFDVETLAPGSVGMFSGLGPRGIDLPPFGPPKINFLIQAGGHLPLLANLEVGNGSKFYGPDLRGPALVGERTSEGEEASARIASWSMDKKGDVSIEVDFFLSRRAEKAADSDDSSLEDILCPSLVYGLPKSFFTQPIAVCAPSLLNFFEI